MNSLFSVNGISRPKLLQIPHHFSPGSISTVVAKTQFAARAAAMKSKVLISFSYFPSPSMFNSVCTKAPQHDFTGPKLVLCSGQGPSLASASRWSFVG